MPEFQAGTPPKGLSDFAKGYIECALWVGVSGFPDDEAQQEEREASWDDLAPLTVSQLSADAEEFRESFGALLDLANELGRDDASLGHDFFLTRNRHGAGFWDRGLGDVGDVLTKMAHPYGDACLYWGDDGSLYLG